MNKSGPAVGFVPAPEIAVRSGLIYYIVVVILLFLSCALLGWLILERRRKERRPDFVPRESAVTAPKMRRFTFFTKLLLLFILLALIPITAASLLMFFSFKEIIDIYVYKPLLFNLKTSREAFLAALNNVQVQAVSLMTLTGLLVVVAAVAVSRSIAGSLRKVSLGMEKVSRGDFSFKLLPDANDEIGDMVNYFNSMSAEIKRARDIMENWNRELEVKVAERTEDLRKALKRLTELDRLKNEFVSMVSHELRTPVTSADGYISLFLAGVTGPLSDDQKKYLAIVKENNQRLLTPIYRLLDFSKIETGRFNLRLELISIHELVQSVVEIMKPQLNKQGAELKLKLEAKGPGFMGDREKMGGALINIIENALKFSKEGEKPVIEIATRNDDNFIAVTVSDDGIGIAQEYLETIFDKFFQVADTLTRKAGGVGLGLALAKDVIEAHHGKIWAESAGLGQGSRFVFQVPVAEKI